MYHSPMTRLLERLRMTEGFKTTSWCPFPDSTSGTSKLNEQIELIQLSTVKSLEKEITDHLARLIWNSNMWWDCIFPGCKTRCSSSVTIFQEGLLSENHMIKSSGDLIFPESTWFPLGFPHCCAWYCSSSYCCWLQIELLYMVLSLSLSSSFLLLLSFLFLSLLLVVPLHRRKNRWLNSQKVAICIRGHDKTRHMGVAPSILSSWYIWGLPKIVDFPPKSSILNHFNRVFHYFHHPFWGTSVAKTTCPDTYLTDLRLKMFGFKHWQYYMTEIDGLNLAWTIGNTHIIVLVNYY